MKMVFGLRLKKFVTEEKVYQRVQNSVKKVLIFKLSHQLYTILTNKQVLNSDQKSSLWIMK